MQRRRWALGLLAWSALAFTIAYLNHDENQRLDGAPTVPAVITDIDRWTKGGPELELEIQLPDGRTVTGRTNNFNDVHPNGARIAVQYAIDEGDVYVREAGTGPDHAGVWGWLAAGSGATLAGAFLLVRRARVDQLGQAVEDGGQAEGEGVGGVHG